MALNGDVLTGKTPAKKSKVTVVDLGKKKGSFKIHKGRLHRALGIPEDQTIPKERLRKELHSKDPEIAAMAHSALGLEGMAKK